MFNVSKNFSSPTHERKREVGRGVGTKVGFTIFHGVFHWGKRIDKSNVGFRIFYSPFLLQRRETVAWEKPLRNLKCNTHSFKRRKSHQGAKVSWSLEAQGAPKAWPFVK